jgi:hypothetical protein
VSDHNDLPSGHYIDQSVKILTEILARRPISPGFDKYYYKQVEIRCQVQDRKDSYKGRFQGKKFLFFIRGDRKGEKVGWGKDSYIRAILGKNELGPSICSCV